MTPFLNSIKNLSQCTKEGKKREIEGRQNGKKEMKLYLYLGGKKAPGTNI